MNKKYRKVLAAILAATMVLGSGIVANADTGSGEGTGEAAVVEKSDIFDVILPTTAGTNFNYILNPTDVIGATDHAKYSATSSFVDGKTMYFAQKPANGVATYSDVSEPITAYNLSTMDVGISVEASVATPSGIEVAGAKHPGAAGSHTTTPTATPSIYLGVVASASGASPVAITTAKTEVLTATISNASAYYKVTYATASDTYKKELNATGSDAKEAGADANCNGVFKSYSFMLTGSCNPDGKWEGVKDSQLPKVSLTWTIDNPTGPSVTVSNDGIITVSGLTPEKNYVSSDVILDGEANRVDVDSNIEWDTDSWDRENGGTLIFKLNDAWKTAIRNATSTKIVVNMNDDTTIEAPISIS